MHKKCIFINKIIDLVYNKKYIKLIIIGHSSDDSEVIVKAFLDASVDYFEKKPTNFNNFKKIILKDNKYIIPL
jgi:hypothetical protein